MTERLRAQFDSLDLGRAGITLNAVEDAGALSIAEVDHVRSLAYESTGGRASIRGDAVAIVTGYIRVLDVWCLFDGRPEVGDDLAFFRHEREAEVAYEERVRTSGVEWDQSDL